ncbi:MAG: hypothetical protein XU14_C0033G0026 [Armatimonadetes bacterium CSP1-3]|nr:MAG: hypothetical protein XU14_C0033G0026 [Armatimonadetes bacterium CSP1-3]
MTVFETLPEFVHAMRMVIYITKYKPAGRERWMLL